MIIPIIILVIYTILFIGAIALIIWAISSRLKEKIREKINTIEIF